MNCKIYPKNGTICLAIGIISLTILYNCGFGLFINPFNWFNYYNFNYSESNLSGFTSIKLTLINKSKLEETTTPVFQSENFYTTINSSDIAKRETWNPPKLTKAQKKNLSQISKNPIKLSQMLSFIIQAQIRSLQSPGNCKNPKFNNILCGHYNKMCGFGCQVHHRAACLMISYGMGLPLIHDMETGWSHTEKWTELFLPLGADCTPNSNTYKWSWRQTKEYYSKQQKQNTTNLNWDIKNQTELAYPLSHGIVISAELLIYVKKLHPQPFVWMVGQFIKYSLRLQSNVAKRVERDTKSIGFDSSCVGIHVRRTDKINESNKSVHSLKEYISSAESWFKGELAKKLHPSNFLNQTRQIFLASDDSKALETAQKCYPKPNWNIIGFSSKVTLKNPKERRNYFYEIVRDIIILSDCDFIICGHSSNVCRVLLEMLSYKYLEVGSRLKSLDGSYSYALARHSMKREVVGI